LQKPSSLVWTDKWLICVHKCYVSFKVCTQMSTAVLFFMFRSGLSDIGINKGVLCINYIPISHETSSVFMATSNKLMLFKKNRFSLCESYQTQKYKTKTPWLLVRKRTIPSERPPLVGEVSANFCG
jgi:hypothetical protein